MPAGVTWSQYLCFSAASLLSMLAGSQVVHLHYKPLMDFHKYINNELKYLPENVQVKIRDELKEEGLIK